VVFPQTVVPLVVNRPAGMKLIDDVHGSTGDRLIGLATQRSPDVEEPTLEDLYDTICVGSILKMLKFPDGSTRIVCQGLVRARLTQLDRTEPYLVGQVEPLEEAVEEGEELDALVHLVNGLFNRLSDNVPEELQVAAMNTRD